MLGMGVAPARAAVWELSFEEAVQGVVNGNPDLRAARYALEAARESEQGVFSPFLPSVSAGLNWTQGSDTSDSRRWSGSLVATQNIFNGFGDTARFQRAEALTLAARESLRIAGAQALYDVRVGFAAVIYARGAAELAKTIITRRTDNLRLVQLRFQSGLENRGSVLLSEAYLAQAKYDALVAENAQREAEAQLARAIGMESPSGERVEFNLKGDVPWASPDATPPEFTSLARETPTVRQTRAQVQGAERSMVAARANFFPTLDARGSVTSVGPSITPIERDGWSLGLSLSLPLFDGYKDTHAVREATATLRQTEAESSSTYLATVQKLEQTFADFREAVLKLDVDEKFRTAALLRAEISRKRYNNGLLSFENWDQIENDLISRQKAYLISRRDRGNAEAAWDQAVGKGVGP